MRGERRVVVTGLGLVSPLGLNVDDSWRTLLSGHSGIRPIAAFDASQWPTRIAGEVWGFDPSAWLSPQETKRSDLFIQYAVAASTQALQDAGLIPEPDRPERIGVFIGTGVGGIGTTERAVATLSEQGVRRVSPFTVTGMGHNMASGLLAARFGLCGPNLSVCSACASGTHSIGMAARAICYGDADAMVAGGAEAGVTPIGIAAFSAMRALSQHNESPAAASRPWHLERDGFVAGAGAGALLLEERERALQRGATIYAELLGFSATDDGVHIAAPPKDGDGARRAMSLALADAEIEAGEVDHINAHATATPLGDIAEVRAIRSVFPRRSGGIAVSATKSMTGHMLGAAGAIEAIFTVLALRDQVVPPTINLDRLDPECVLDWVSAEAREWPMRYAISNSFGFGGANSVLLFGCGEG